MATHNSIGVEITDASGRPAAGLAAEVAPGTASPHEAALALANFIQRMAAGSESGTIRTRIDTCTDYAASTSFTVTGANIAATETIAIISPSGVPYVLTCVASGAVSGDGTFNASGTDNTVATNIRAAINTLPGLNKLVSAAGSTNTIALTAAVAGVIGNSIKVIDGTTNGTSLSGSSALFTGGLDAGSRCTSTVALTHANLSNSADTLSLGNVTLTWYTSPSGENQVAIGASATAAGDNLVSKIQNHSALAGLVTASNAAGTVTLTWHLPPRVAAQVVVATNDATAMAVTQPSLGSRTTANTQTTRLYQFGRAV